MRARAIAVMAVIAVIAAVGICTGLSAQDTTGGKPQAPERT